MPSTAWTILTSRPAGPAIAARGWTHVVGIVKPKGRRIYTACAVMVDGQVVKMSQPALTNI